MPPWLSDALCRLATGGGFSTRKLYTDDEEQLFNAQRPTVLNGIEDFIDRPDLADRAVFLTLEPIPENKRKADQALKDDFDRARPQILASLLWLLSDSSGCRGPISLDCRAWPTSPSGALPASVSPGRSCGLMR